MMEQAWTLYDMAKKSRAYAVEVLKFLAKQIAPRSRRSNHE
jgi:hypothetical protein